MENSCMSSPSRLNNKLRRTVIPCSESNPEYYDYIYRTMNTSCSDLEGRLRELSYRTSSLKNYSRYPLTSSFGAFITGKHFYPSRNRMNRFYYTTSETLGRMNIERGMSEKDRIINQFCSLGKIAIEKLGRLSEMNMNLASKRDCIDDKNKIDGNDNDDNKRIMNSLCRSVEKLEKDQSDCNKKLNSMIYNSSMGNDYTRKDVYNNTGSTGGYYSPRTEEKDIYMIREQLHNTSKDSSNSEVRYEKKIKELKDQISILEKDIEHIKSTQNQYQINNSFNKLIYT